MAAPVILYSTSLRRWEVWSGGRPVAHASTPDQCAAAYPAALPVADSQLRLAASDAR